MHLHSLLTDADATAVTCFSQTDHMSDETYESLPQRGGGRGRRSAAAQEHPANQSHVDVSADRMAAGEPPRKDGDLQDYAASPEARAVGRYRTDAVGDACYECELRYCYPHVTRFV